MSTEQELLEKAKTDSSFREQLKSDPRGAISSATGVDVPEGVDIVVLEDTPSKVHIVLPATGAGAQLSEQELEQVAGGSGGKTGGSSCTSCGMGNTCDGVISLWGNCPNA